MAGIINKYAASLLDKAQQAGKLEEFYHGALLLFKSEKNQSFQAPEELQAFVDAINDPQVKPVLERFLELARDELRLIDVEIIIAKELTPLQLQQLEKIVIKNVRKRVNIKTEIDPSIIGGLRIIIGNYVIDNSIKNQFEQMKKTLYEEVYFRYE